MAIKNLIPSLAEAKQQLRLLAMTLLFLSSSLPAHAVYPCSPTGDYVSINQRMQSALLFRIHKCGLPDSYLFGTFHSDSPQLQPIYDQASGHLSNTTQLGLELVLDDNVRRQAAVRLTLPAKHPGLKAMLGDELFTKVTTAVAPILKIDAKTLDNFKPWAIAVLTQYPPPEGDGIVLDEKLQAIARQKGLSVFGLETLEEQFSVFDSMSDKDQIDFLRSSLDEIDGLEKMQADLKARYLARDLTAIQKMSDDLFRDMAKTYPKLAAELESQIIFERNKRMAERMEKKFKKPTFIAIGALHLPGEKGVLALLEKDGFEIDAVK